MKKVSLVALHGFLGKLTDWQSVLPDAQALDLYQFGTPSTANCFTTWAGRCDTAMRALPTPRVLVGYSLGGRLALHALLRDPTVWQGLVIVSAHPGLTDLQERLKREEQDELWAKRFESEPWEQVLSAWEAQPVLMGKSSLPMRDEQDYDRAQLAATLRHCSLGKQENLKKLIGKIHVPILWIAGADDTQYTMLAQSVPLSHPHSRVWIAPNAGHRVPWQQSLLFRERVEQFVGEL